MGKQQREQDGAADPLDHPAAPFSVGVAAKEEQELAHECVGRGRANEHGSREWSDSGEDERHPSHPDEQRRRGFVELDRCPADAQPSVR